MAAIQSRPRNRYRLPTKLITLSYPPALSSACLKPRSNSARIQKPSGHKINNYRRKLHTSTTYRPDGLSLDFTIANTQPGRVQRVADKRNGGLKHIRRAITLSAYSGNRLEEDDERSSQDVLDDLPRFPRGEVLPGPTGINSSLHRHTVVLPRSAFPLPIIAPQPPGY